MKRNLSTLPEEGFQGLGLLLYIIIIVIVAIIIIIIIIINNYSCIEIKVKNTCVKLGNNFKQNVTVLWLSLINLDCF